jgi:hypothetical protein
MLLSFLNTQSKDFVQNVLSFMGKEIRDEEARVVTHW